MEKETEREREESKEGGFGGHGRREWLSAFRKALHLLSSLCGTVAACV